MQQRPLNLQNVEPIDYLSNLPAELQLHILSFLDTSSVKQMSLTSRNFLTLSRDAQLKEHFYRRDYPKLYTRIKNRFQKPLMTHLKREYTRLCVDYDVPKKTRDNILLTKKWIEKSQAVARNHFDIMISPEHIMTNSIQKVVNLHLHKNPTCTLPAHIPDKISVLTNLSSLFIEYPLKSLSPEIGQLKKLTYLRLINTQLKTLPEEFYDLTQLSLLVYRKLRIDSKSQEMLKKMVARNPNLSIIEEGVDSVTDKIIIHFRQLFAVW